MRKLAFAVLPLMLICATAGATEVRKEVPAAPGETLSVDLKTGGAINVTGSDRNSVAVTMTTEGEGTLTVNRAGNTIEVRGDMTSHVTRNRGTNVDIEVPRRFTLDLHTMGGAVKVSHVEGTISGKTMGGALDFKGLKGTVNFTTMGGRIDLADSDVDGKLSTYGGAVLFHNVVGDVKASSMGGNVQYENVRRRDGTSSSEGVVISTMGGRIDVPTAPDGADVKTMGGDIKIDTARKFVKAHTMGGDIRIGEVDGSVEATTMGGAVEAKVIGANGSHDVTLKSMGGPITLTLPANFDGSFDISLSYTKNSRGTYQVKSDFPLNISEPSGWEYGKGTPRRVIKAEGKSGSGKNVVKISTINGDVVIKKQ